MTTYLICTSPRSGSNLLCEALTKTGVAGGPAEYFFSGFKDAYSTRWKIDPQLDYVAYLREVVAKISRPTGVFAAKLMQEQLTPLLAELRRANGGSTDREVMEEFLPGVRIILLSREDKLRQAISFWRAQQTKSWTKAQAAVTVPVFDFEKIDGLLARFIRESAAWKKWCATNRFAPLELTYEQLTGAYERTVQSALNFIGAPAARVFPPERYLPQRDGLNDEWAERYLARKSERSKWTTAARWLTPWRLFLCAGLAFV